MKITIDKADLNVDNALLLSIALRDLADEQTQWLRDWHLHQTGKTEWLAETVDDKSPLRARRYNNREDLPREMCVCDHCGEAVEQFQCGIKDGAGHHQFCGSGCLDNFKAYSQEESDCEDLFLGSV